VALLATAFLVCAVAAGQEAAPRARDLGIVIGSLPPGPNNAITDVQGVAVGHSTIVEGSNVRTGVTVVIPRLGENTYWHKVPAAVYTGNGFGKAAGFTQVAELGNLEAPIALTNTLSVGTVLDAMVRRSLSLPGNEEVRSVNVVVGETNDGYLNDIRGLFVKPEHVAAAWKSAKGGPVEEGCVGAGTGTRCFGYKGGMGTSSRRVEEWIVGVLVQSNFGGRLRADGEPFPPQEPRKKTEAAGGAKSHEDGSCMIVVATDAPLGSRNLRRLAKRALLGLARTGSVMSNGSGDYVIAFSTFAGNVTDTRKSGPRAMTVLPNRQMTEFFWAVADATEESVLNSLFAAKTTTGRDGHIARAIDVDELRRYLEH
jgi:D-aminopeptidase